MDIFQRVRERTISSSDELTLEEYLHLCKEDKSVFASPFQRMLKAMGESRLIDTSLDARLGRLFQNRKIKIWESFKDFYGLEDVVETLHRYFTAAAQGVEEARQILYLLGPVGGKLNLPR